METSAPPLEPPSTTWSKRIRQWSGLSLVAQEDKILLVLTLIIGALVGLVIAGFIYVTENLGVRMYPTGGAPWRRLVIPVLGSLFSGYLLSRYFPNARGSGIPQTKAALFLRDGFISFRSVFGRFVCSSMSLASGIALGREGPSVHTRSFLSTRQPGRVHQLCRAGRCWRLGLGLLRKAPTPHPQTLSQGSETDLLAPARHTPKPLNQIRAIYGVSSNPQIEAGLTQVSRACTLAAVESLFRMANIENDPAPKAAAAL